MSKLLGRSYSVLNGRGEATAAGSLWKHFLNSHKDVFFSLLVFCLFPPISFRTWRSESIRGRFCEWSTAAWCCSPKDCGTCPSRCPALRHLQAIASQPWLRQQNSWQVKADQSESDHSEKKKNNAWCLCVGVILRNRSASRKVTKPIIRIVENCGWKMIYLYFWICDFGNMYHKLPTEPLKLTWKIAGSYC